MHYPSITVCMHACESTIDYFCGLLAEPHDTERIQYVLLFHVLYSAFNFPRHGEVQKCLAFKIPPQIRQKF